MGIFGGIFGGGGGDTTPPTITVVSPTPGVAPGQPGGFPTDFRAATVTPIVLDITDITPGLELIVVSFHQASPSPGEHDVEEVVYRAGQFRGGYVAGSSQESITNGIRLHCVRAEGWPGSDQPGWWFEVDAVDSAGNEAT